jgi:arabinogalactan oligomer/maltooligosaccharide transport system substrate-binding protein
MLANTPFLSIKKIGRIKREINKGVVEMNKKGIVLCLFCMLMAVALIGCGDTQTAGNSSDKAADAESADKDKAGVSTVKLKFWCDEDELSLFQEMIDAFCAEHKDEAEFEMEYETVGASACKDTIMEDINNAADVFSMPDDQLLTLVSAGILEEISYSDEIKERNIEGSVDGASVNGTVYAYPVTADNGYFLYYNKKYFKDSDVETLDQILAICKKNKKKFVMDFSSGWYLYAFFGNTGLQVGINDDGLTNYCDWNSTENSITGVDVAESLLRITTNPGFESNSDLAAAERDNAIAIVSGIWDINTIKECYGEDYGACKLPTYTCKGEQIQMASFTGYRLLGVNSYSPYREWAEKLAEYLSNEDNQKLRFERSERGPSNKNAGDSDEVAQIPAIKAVLEQSEFGTLQKISPKFWTPTTNFGNIMAAGNPDNIPLQDLLDEMVSGITE